MFRYAVAALVVACSPAPTHAQPRCADANSLADRLSEQYGESVILRGMDARGGLVEWWQNEETGTWTLVVLTPNELRCLVASGDMGEAIQPEPAGLRL